LAKEINEKEDFTMGNKENEESRFLQGFLIGGILGVLAGLLFAPKPGKELRSEIKQKGEEALDEAKHLYSETRTKANAILEDARRRAEELKKEASRHLAEARQKAKEILRRQEEKVVGARESEKEGKAETKKEPKEPVGGGI
jgi:gas vesicle protein